MSQPRFLQQQRRGLVASLGDGGGAPSSLLTGLVSWWKLDEESGVRADSVGSNDLSDNNTVLYDTGLIGNAAKFVATNSESLSRASVSATQDLTVSFWLKTTSAVADVDHLGLFTAWAANGAFHFRSGPTVMTFLAASGVAFAQATTQAGDLAPTVNDGNWHLWIGTFTNADTTARLYFEGNNIGTTTGNLGAGISTAAHTLFVGGGLLGYVDQTVDMVGIWSRVLTGDEMTELYNSGAGLDYPF